jgi:hypothetical protein
MLILKEYLMLRQSLESNAPEYGAQIPKTVGARGWGASVDTRGGGWRDGGTSWRSGHPHIPCLRFLSASHTVVVDTFDSGN